MCGCNISLYKELPDLMSWPEIRTGRNDDASPITGKEFSDTSPDSGG